MRLLSLGGPKIRWQWTAGSHPENLNIQSRQYCDDRVATMLFEALRGALRVIFCSYCVFFDSSKLFELIPVVVIFVVILMGPKHGSAHCVVTIVCIYIYIYIYICIHIYYTYNTYISLYIYIHTHICIHMCIHIYIYIYIYICTFRNRPSLSARGPHGVSLSIIMIIIT